MVVQGNIIRGLPLVKKILATNLNSLQEKLFSLFLVKNKILDFRF
jgi:hypothetical protein